MLHDPRHDIKLKDEAALALDCAADLLERTDWMQFDYCYKDKAYCVLGAIQQVTTGHPQVANSLTAVCALRFQEYLPRRKDIVSWNDARGRRKEQVIAVLRQASNGDT